MDPSDVTTLADAISGLKWWSLGLLVLAFVVWRGFLFFEKKEERKLKSFEQKNKNDRNDKFVNVLSKQAGAINTLSSSISENTTLISSNYQDLKISIDTNSDRLMSLTNEVHELKDKTSGIMSVDDSLSIIGTYFSHISREVSFILAQSLSENDFDNRADFISKKVRTSIADVVVEARKNVCNIETLCIDPRRFFKIYINEDNLSGERFILCDLIWNAVVPIYKKDYTLKMKIQESKLLVKNVTNDYFNSIKNIVKSEVEQTHTATTSLYKKTHSDH